MYSNYHPCRCVDVKMIDLVLYRRWFKDDGIFGILHLSPKIGLYTLEHSYHMQSKVPQGTYLCERGIHILKHGSVETFQVTHVPDHNGILFHPGNTEHDSDGCILLGTSLSLPDNIMSIDRLISSQSAFSTFMNYLEDVNRFTLIIENDQTEILPQTK